MRRVVIIASQEDRQAVRWEKLCQASGLETSFLLASDVGQNWSVVVSSGDDPWVSVPGKQQNHIADPTICWYLRGPTEGTVFIREQIQLLHRLLAHYAYPLGNYFQEGDEEAITASKPTQAAMFRGSFPLTRITSAPSRFDSGDWVVKSISGIRSIVVDGQDERLSYSHARFAAPVQFQKRVMGAPVKVHWYRTRRETWLILAVAASATGVDYRYCSESEYEIMPMRAHWYLFANDLFARLRTRFFDFDLIDSEDGELFLEVNTSPAPAYFEDATSNFSFSARVLCDWVCG